MPILPPLYKEKVSFKSARNILQFILYSCTMLTGHLVSLVCLKDFCLVLETAATATAAQRTPQCNQAEQKGATSERKRLHAERLRFNILV